MRNPSILKQLLVLAVAVTGILFAVSPSQAARPTVAEQIQHYLECLDWMINNPARHAEECAPGHVYIIPDPKSGGTPSKPDCDYQIPSAFVEIGRRGHDGCPPKPCYNDVGFVQTGDYGCPPPCYDRVGFVQTGDYGCPEPCTEKMGFVQTGDHGCPEEPGCELWGSLTLEPAPDAWMLVAEEYEPPHEGGCPTSLPLSRDELRLFAI